MTEEEIARIREGLVIFKNCLMSVWKSVVPYRDPKLLPRQWRVATGTQMPYKFDEQKKKKRRLYESNRRKGKPGNPIKWHSSSEKEDCSALARKITVEMIALTMRMKLMFTRHSLQTGGQILLVFPWNYQPRILW